MSSQARYISRLPMNTVLSQVYPFLSTFAKLRKATVASSCLSLNMCICLSFRPPDRKEQLGSQWADFSEI